MKTITKPVYYCEHCKKHGLSKPKMEHHENICFHNPKNFRPCFECANLNKKAVSIYSNYSNGNEWERKVELFHCKAKECFLYTPQNEIKGNYFELGDDFNEPMPHVCDVFKKMTDEEKFDKLFEL